MGRIRSIKPEFPQSESVGNLSRDARLLFIQLWTVVDDDGRARAPSRMLASLLYPYDDDAPQLINGWLDELEEAECIRRYSVDGHHYLDIPKWLDHQKIDHKKDSKLPPYTDGVATPRDASRMSAPDQGSRIKDQGGEVAAVAAPALSETKGSAKRATRISPDWVPSESNLSFARSRGVPEASLKTEADKFRDHWLQKSKDGAKLDWDAAWRTWIMRACEFKEWAPVGETLCAKAVQWVLDDDPLAPSAKARWRSERGKDPPHVAGEGGMGWHFPAEWFAVPPSAA